MPRKTNISVDPAIIEALGLDPDPGVTRIESHGGSGFASTFKLISQKASTNGTDETQIFFVKTGHGKDSEVMFRGEHASLNAIQSIVPDFCPRSYAYGVLQNKRNTYFLATEFLDLGSSYTLSSGSGPHESLAQRLAKLHTTPAEPPQGTDLKTPMFGFPVPTCCGATPQDNTWKASWAEFYAENRLRAVHRQIIEANGGASPNSELAGMVEKVVAKVVPRLLDNDMIRSSILPVLIHGDLWSGNHGSGRFVGRNLKDGRDVQEVVFDPSCVYGHSEYELGIMRMFGGFGATFWKEYDSLVPKAEPKEEWDDRVELYQLYHYLNHWALFGGGYSGSAMNIMKQLVRKYG